jgi:hypothetical protein
MWLTNSSSGFHSAHEYVHESRANVPRDGENNASGSVGASARRELPEEKKVSLQKFRQLSIGR